MRTVYAQKNKKIILGRQGEDKAVRVVWPGIVSDWSSLYGDGSFQLSVRRFSDENAYPVAVEVSGDDIRFTVTSAETAIAGNGKCELTYIANGTIAKSATWETVVLNSLTGQAPSEPPEEPAKSWFTAIQGQIGNLADLETASKDNLVAAINEAAQSGGGGGGSGASIELDTTLTQSGKAADAKAVGDALAKINNTKTEEVTETVTVRSENVTLDSTAPSQTVNLAWNVPGGKTIPPFTNYYIENSNISYPRTFNTSGYTQFFGSGYHGNAEAFVSGHQYFQAFHYAMDGESTAEIKTSSVTYITPTNNAVISGSGWVYMLGKPANSGAVIFNLNKTSTGTGTIDYLYCIDVTALQEAGTITATTVNELAELFGGMELIPGQDYVGSITSGMATLNITRDGETTTVDSGTATATVQGGDILSVEGGSVTFLLKVLREVYVDPISVWSGKKWVAFGDSLTDETINADKKYYRYIEEKTGITVVVMGAGGTGYYKGYDSGTAYGQRMASVPADADIITIFGSVNDWHTKSAGVAMGNASDTMEAGTLAGYINECIDVAIEKAPYAQIALVTPMDYNGLPDDTLEGIANIIKAVAAYRKIKCLDLYHESGFRVRNPIFAAVYTTDYSTTAESYGHPSNLAHEQLIAPEFMELLKRMLLTA